MAQQRIYLDATSGQPWTTATDILPAAASFGWALGTGFHAESAKSRALAETALATLASAWGVPVSGIVAVHNLSNAFALAVESLEGNVRYSPTNRLGAIAAIRSVHPNAQALQVDRGGYIELASIGAADWLAVQAGNHETGSLDPLAELRSDTGAKLLVDATEWAGRMDSAPIGDVIVVRASSWGGPLSTCFVVYPEGAPTLSARRRQMLSPEPALVAVAASALERVGDVQARSIEHHVALRTLASSLDKIPGLSVHADFSRARLPHILSFSVENIDAEALAHALDQRGFAVGAGSACVGEVGERSHVLTAMGVRAEGNIRVSLPLTASADDLEKFAVAVADAISDLGAF